MSWLNLASINSMTKYASWKFINVCYGVKILSSDIIFLCPRSRKKQIPCKPALHKSSFWMVCEAFWLLPLSSIRNLRRIHPSLWHHILWVEKQNNDSNNIKGVVDILNMISLRNTVFHWRVTLDKQIKPNPSTAWDETRGPQSAAATVKVFDRALLYSRAENR